MELSLAALPLGPGLWTPRADQRGGCAPGLVAVAHGACLWLPTCSPEGQEAVCLATAFEEGRRGCSGSCPPRIGKCLTLQADFFFCKTTVCLLFTTFPDWLFLFLLFLHGFKSFSFSADLV